MSIQQLTPRQIVAELDRYIVGQAAAKKAVAIAMRSRFRRQLVDAPLRDDIAPKNIILIGPTGVGKTEIARRIAKLAQAPFVKVEASKFTEVGYVGRDVESMIRDLTEVGIKLVRAEWNARVRDKATLAVEDRILDALLPRESAPLPVDPPDADNPTNSSRERLRKMLRDGALDQRKIEVEVRATGTRFMPVFSGQGMEEVGLNFSEMLGNLMPQQGRKRQVTVAEARTLLLDDEAAKLIDNEAVTREAIERVETTGIVFIDEIDKIAAREGARGADVSREGVQRDLLPIVEGSTVSTKHGMVRTDHVLFIAGGAFHIAKVSDLIPELQGRFPIRQELSSLSEDDFFRILTEPDNALTRQYEALMRTEGVELEFTEDALRELARLADEVNRTTENVGARRLHTLLEKLLEDVSFNAPDMPGTRIVVDVPFVRAQLAGIVANTDLSRYIL